MKTVLAMLALCTALVFTGCSSDESSTNPTTNGTKGSMSAKIDGADWTGSLSVVGVYANDLLSIAGQDNNTRQIQLRLIGVKAPGTYQFGGMTNPNTATVIVGLNTTDSYTASLVAGTGTVNITVLTAQRAEGTFSFTGRNTAGATKQVSEGTFNVTF
jgi:Family of unknown function (DUF6252)